MDSLLNSVVTIVSIYIIYLATTVAITLHHGFAYEKLGGLPFISTYVNIDRDINLNYLISTLHTLNMTGSVIKQTCSLYHENPKSTEPQFEFLNTNTTINGLGAINACAHFTKDNHAYQAPIFYDFNTLQEYKRFITERQLWRTWVGLLP